MLLYTLFRGGSMWTTPGAQAPIDPEKKFVHPYRKYAKIE